jgi:transcriptional regulator GlxA family with amidase domain
MEIAVACGFESPPHFSRCYRSHFGCPPSTERQRREARAAAVAGTARVAARQPPVA